MRAVRAPHQHHQREDLRLPLVLVHHPLISHPSRYRMFSLVPGQELPLAAMWLGISSHYGLFTSFAKKFKFYYKIPCPRAIKMSSFNEISNFPPDLQHTLVLSLSSVREPLKCRLLLKFQNFPPYLLHHVGLVLFPSPRAIKMWSFTKISNFPPDLLHHVGPVLLPGALDNKMSFLKKNS